jgi:hypothetical protein
MTEKWRVFKTELQDVLNTEKKVREAVVSGKSPENFRRWDAIAESKIAEFCNGCDHLATDNVCRQVGANSQARYAAPNRELCGWSEVNGVRGVMTDAGFEPVRKNPEAE